MTLPVLFERCCLAAGLGTAIGAILALATGHFPWGRGLLASIASAAFSAVVLVVFTVAVVVAFNMRAGLPETAAPDGPPPRQAWRGLR